MDPTPTSSIVGRVRSLHVHPDKPGALMQEVTAFEMVEGMGIREDRRYFARQSRSTGKPSLRQVTLMARELIAEHARSLRLEQIAPGAVRANIETEQIALESLIGHNVQVGEAVLFFYEVRTPCAKMDAICQGLRGLMENGKQGVLAQVIQSGQIRVGDPIVLAPQRADLSH